MYYDHLFEMCGYEIDEIKQEAPRIEKLRCNAARRPRDAPRLYAGDFGLLSGR